MALFQHQELNKRLIAQMNEPVTEKGKKGQLWGRTQTIHLDFIISLLFTYFKD